MCTYGWATLGGMFFLFLTLSDLARLLKTAAMPLAGWSALGGLTLNCCDGGCAPPLS
jgi:hypothetical protein